MTKDAIDKARIGKLLIDVMTPKSFTELTPAVISGKEVLIFNNKSCKESGISCDQAYFNHRNFIFQFRSNSQAHPGPADEYDRMIEKFAKSMLATFKFF